MKRSELQEMIADCLECPAFEKEYHWENADSILGMIEQYMLPPFKHDIDREASAETFTWEPESDSSTGTK